MKKIILCFSMFFIFNLLNASIFAISTESIISDIKTKAEIDKFRFMQIDKNGITQEIKDNIAKNDELYLNDKPTGSIKIKVLDVATGKPVKDAQCLLTFSIRRSTVNTDGTSNQYANPFFLIDLGKIPESGELIYTDTYFYTSRKVSDYPNPFADTLQVSIANIVDADPEITIDYSAKNYIATSDEVNFEKIVTKLNSREKVKISEFKQIIRDVSTAKYVEILRNLFNDKFAVYSDDVMVKVNNEPQYKKLIDEGKEKLTIAELKKFIEENIVLLENQVAKKYYEDFGGFKPNFVLDHEPAFESTITYKDGTKKPTTGRAYLSMQIFDDVIGGTGYAISKSAFPYKAYVYADGYMQGEAVGSVIRQDLINKDVTMIIYLSKDYVPLVTVENTNTIFGTLKDKNNKPISSATISIEDTDLKSVSNENGFFNFTKLKNEKIKLNIINPENGEVLKAKAIYKGVEYPLDNIPITLSENNQVFEIALIGGLEASNGFPMWIILIIIILILVLLYIFFIKRKEKNYCVNCGKEIEKNNKLCDICKSKLNK